MRTCKPEMVKGGDEPSPSVVLPNATVPVCKPRRHHRQRSIVIERTHIRQGGSTIDDAAHPMFFTPFRDISD